MSRIDRVPMMEIGFKVFAASSVFEAQSLLGIEIPRTIDFEISQKSGPWIDRDIKGSINTNWRNVNGQHPAMHFS